MLVISDDDDDDEHIHYVALMRMMLLMVMMMMMMMMVMIGVDDDLQTQKRTCVKTVWHQHFAHTPTFTTKSVDLTQHNTKHGNMLDRFVQQKT